MAVNRTVWGIRWKRTGGGRRRKSNQGDEVIGKSLGELRRRTGGLVRKRKEWLREMPSDKEFEVKQYFSKVSHGSVSMVSLYLFAIIILY